jgi:hypothetical protein
MHLPMCTMHGMIVHRGDPIHRQIMRSRILDRSYSLRNQRLTGFPEANTNRKPAAARVFPRGFAAVINIRSLSNESAVISAISLWHWGQLAQYQARGVVTAVSSSGVFQVDA